jgi:probable addiction module antidote protein
MKTGKAETKEFDVATLLDSPEAISVFLIDAFEDGDAAYLTHALGVAARAQGMSEIARKTGLSRESLYKALSTDGNPEFATILKVLRALDLKLVAKAA